MKKTLLSMSVLSAFLLGAGLFHAGPAQAAFVTQLDITGGSISLNFGSLGSLSGNFTQDGQLVMGQYQPLPHIVPPMTVAGHTFLIFTSNQPFAGNPGGAPVPTGTTSDSTITVDLRSLFAGVAGPFLNSSLNIGEPATGTFNAATNAFDIAWTQPFTGLGLLTSGTFSLRGKAQVAAAPVPLPAAIILFGSGLCGAVGMVLRRNGPLKRQDLGSSSGVHQTEPTCSGEVLLVSSDHAFIGDVAAQLQRSGYACQSATSVAEILKVVRQRPPALVLADRRISDWDMLRTEAVLSHVPILILIPTGVTGSEEDIVTDLERGADGVYSCQDGQRLFVATIGTYLRRAGYDSARRGVYQVGGIALDADLHEVKIGKQLIPLSAKPFSILQSLMSSPSKVFTRGELIDLVWGPGFAVGEHTLDVHIHAIRQHLERHPDHLCRLVSIKGVGFKLQAISSPKPTSGRVMNRSMAPMAADAGLPLNSTLGRPDGIQASLAESTVGAAKDRLKLPACRRRTRSFRKAVAIPHSHAVALAG